MALVQSENLLVWDYVAIVVYFGLNLLVGSYALCRPNRGSISGYFLAGRFVGWLPVGASLMATNIGSEHFIGLSGSGAASGIGIGAFNFNPVFLLPLMCWVFLPVYIASGVRTVPEYMNKRFGGQRIQVYLALLSLLLYIFTKISVDLYSGALFINQALKWDIYGSMLALLVLTALFTVTGGLAAVIYTDTLQLFIMLGGALFVMVKAFQEVGGYEALQYRYMQAVPKLTYENTSCGLPRDDSWIMLRHPVDSDLPWPAFLFGQTPASIWYWCADQVIRTTYSTRLDKHTKEDEQDTTLSNTLTNRETLPQVQDKEETETEEREVKRVKKVKRWCLWLCGLQVSQHTTAEARGLDHSRALTSLEENPNVKKVLNFCLLTLLSVGICLYTYFSIDPFPKNINPRKYKLSR